MMMQKLRRSGEFIRFGCKSLISSRPNKDSVSRSVSGLISNLTFVIRLRDQRWKKIDFAFVIRMRDEKN